ncbi:MAG: histidine kinase [Bacteroidota bacterium]|nr:histidine kinase [Bacteroidota bacterium]
MIPNLSYKGIIYTFTGFWLVWIAMQTYILVDFGIDFKIAFSDSLLSNLLLGITSFIIFITLKYYQPSKDNFFYLRIWALLLAVANTAILSWGLGYLFSYDTKYADLLTRSVPLRFCFQILMITTITLLNWLGYYLLGQQSLESRKQQTEHLAREAELYNLRQQLQPHFLFNSLNSISALAGSKPEEARNMIQQLSEFLRHTLKKDEQQLVSIQDEMNHVNLYLEIEKVRFGHRLQSVVHIDDGCETMHVPVLVLQPLVENAIKFGLYDTFEPVIIKINVSCMERNLLITISNPFDPTTSDSEKGTGFGLTSVKRRLHLIYARNDLVQTEIKENLFTIKLTLPQQL